MLKTLRLQNFRGFEDHQIPFRELTIIVGKNNAGKSTIVEALRLVAIVVSRYCNLTYRPGPEWAGIGLAESGVSPSLRNFEFSFDRIFHRYGKPPAIVTAVFDKGASVTIYIGENDQVHAVIRNQQGQVVKNRGKAVEADLPSVGIMPQVAPLQKLETILTSEYLEKTISSALAPSHFRNHLHLYRKELFKPFQDLVQDNWPGVAVLELIGEKLGDELHLEVRNDDFVGEVALMGHGLQMWLQAIWFLTLYEDSDTVILDEPDVYMHPDLQRRIVRLMKNRYRQCIITTHSVEILAEVDPENILIVDRKRKSSQFATSLPAVQQLIMNVGSVHNLQLTRLFHSRRLLLVEGKDLSLLKHFQNTLFPDSKDPIDSIPSMSIGGWGCWSYAVGSAMLLKNALGERVKTYCILDSDFHTEAEKQERQNEAARKSVNLHIWLRKEIENYLLEPDPIHRLILKSLRRGKPKPQVDQIAAKISAVAESFREAVLDGLSTAISSNNRRLAPGSANKEARKLIKKMENKLGGIEHLVPGKLAISRLSQWSQTEFGVSLSPITIAREMTQDEVPEELKVVLSAIESEKEFDD